MKKVDMYTDGACSYNPGPGGYGIVLIYNGVEKQFSGFNESTTNNRMEITAVIEGLKKLKEPCDVTIYTDSAYTMNAFDLGWLDDWQAKGWKNSQKKDVLNKDLWQELLQEMSRHTISWVKVKGHSDNKYNNICDKLARAEIDRYLSTKKAD